MVPARTESALVSTVWKDFEMRTLECRSSIDLSFSGLVLSWSRTPRQSNNIRCSPLPRLITLLSGGCLRGPNFFSCTIGERRRFFSLGFIFCSNGLIGPYSFVWFTGWIWRPTTLSWRFSTAFHCMEQLSAKYMMTTVFAAFTFSLKLSCLDLMRLIRVCSKIRWWKKKDCSTTINYLFLLDVFVETVNIITFW